MIEYSKEKYLTDSDKKTLKEISNKLTEDEIHFMFEMCQDDKVWELIDSLAGIKRGYFDDA